MTVSDDDADHQSHRSSPSRLAVALIASGALVISLAGTAVILWPDEARTVEAAITLLIFVLELLRTAITAHHDNPQP